MSHRQTQLQLLRICGLKNKTKNEEKKDVFCVHGKIECIDSYSVKRISKCNSFLLKTPIEKVIVLIIVLIFQIHFHVLLTRKAQFT